MQTDQIKYNVGDYCKPDEFYALKNSSSTNSSYLNSVECVFYIIGYDNTMSDEFWAFNNYYTRTIGFLNKSQMDTTVLCSIHVFMVDCIHDKLK